MSNSLRFHAPPAAVLAAVALCNVSLPWRASAQPPASHRTSSDALLMQLRRPIDINLLAAAEHGDAPAVRALLKRGANPNARNSLYATALEDAGSLEVSEELLKAGADPNSVSPYGTPLLGAALSGSDAVVKLLLAHGARLNVARPDGITPLMLAARAGALDLLKDLLQRKVNVNARDAGGETALIHAVRDGQLGAVKLLLAAGASPSIADSCGRTVVMHAAMVGRADITQALIGAKATPNGRDHYGKTALMIAAACGDHPDAVRALMEAGADASVRDPHGRTAAAIAAQHGYAASARLLGADPLTIDHAGTPMRSPDQAVRLALAAVQQSMLVFRKQTGCISCHHEGLGRMATGVAMAHGFACDATVDRAQVQRISQEMNELRPLNQRALTDSALMNQIPTVDIDDLAMYYGCILSGTAAHRQPPTPTTVSMAMVLARQQQPDGHWDLGYPRVPMESSSFTLTAMAVHALRTYGGDPYRVEADTHISRARHWLLKTPPLTSEDRASRLLGLRWSDASDVDIRKAAADICADQRSDGGWSQLPSMQSDAYATGEALYALHSSGALTTADPTFQRGVALLLRTQEDDGSWFVSKRAVPLNNFIDGGFPHGESQYSSFNATCWALMALAESANTPAVQRADRMWSPERTASAEAAQ